LSRLLPQFRETARLYTVAGIFVAATREEMKGAVVNISDPNEMAVLQLAEKIKAIADRRSDITSRLRQPATHKECLDISKGEQASGWSLNVTLHDGLIKAIEWFALCKRGQ
jgi:nucleoside-diphosphate-sugar epimerase